MDERDSETGNAEFEIENASDGIAAKTVHDVIRMERHRPHARELIANNHPAQSRLHREAEAMEFDPEEVYHALQRVQESYDAFEAAERRPSSTTATTTSRSDSTEPTGTPSSSSSSDKSVTRR